MIKREYGEIPTYETRSEANEKVDKRKRYRQIKKVLKGKELTAKEVAVEMMKKGYIPTSERNYAAPRLTELSIKGYAEIIGKKKCQYSGKMFAVYKLLKF